MLTSEAAGLGAVNDARSAIRCSAAFRCSVGGRDADPSLPLETLRVALKETTIFVRSSGGSGVPAFGQRTGVESVRVGSTVLPTDANGELWLRFAKPDPRRYIPAQTILDNSFDAKSIAGRDIFIGTSAVGLLDLRATPLEFRRARRRNPRASAGADAAGDHLMRPAYATGAELSFLVGIGAAVAWLIYRLGAVATAAIGALAILAVFAASWLAYRQAGLLFDPVYPVASRSSSSTSPPRSTATSRRSWSGIACARPSAITWQPPWWKSSRATTTS